MKRPARNRPLTVRVTEKEELAILRAAALFDQSPSEFMRRCALRRLEELTLWDPDIAAIDPVIRSWGDDDEKGKNQS